LKVTSPTPTSPINGVKPAGVPVVLVVTNSTTTWVSSSLALSYRFELQNAGGTVVESQVVDGGSGTTSRTVAVPLDTDQTYRWRARAEYQGTVGPWSALQSFVGPVGGYNRPGALYDPLTNSSTVGSIFGRTTWMPGQGIKINDQNSYVVYNLSPQYSSGEISVEVTNMGPGGSPGKARVLSIQDRPFAAASLAKHSINVQYRGAGGDPDNCITWKAVLGDNANSVEPPNRFNNIYSLDPSKTYFFASYWTPSSVRVTVRENNATGAIVYDELVKATSGTTDWSPLDEVFAFIGTSNSNYTGFDGSRINAIWKNLWVGSTPRPANIP
jgi:hypothetical protein